MPFYRILLVARNDLPVASLYNKFVETAKYVMNNGGVFQRIYNTGDHPFRYSCMTYNVRTVGIPCTAEPIRERIQRALSFLFNSAVPLP